MEHRLEYKPQQAVRFYAIIVAATMAGVAIDFLHINPIRALFWSAVLNGVVAVPLMAAMMILVGRRKIMGRFVAEPMVLAFGWAATLVMAAATILFFASLL